jgi:hypothetical protein
MAIISVAITIIAVWLPKTVCSKDVATSQLVIQLMKRQQPG